MGLNLEEVNALPDETLARLVENARTKLAKMGAHYVVYSIAEVPAVVEVIPEIGVCGGGSPPAHPYFRNFSARLKHALLK